MIKKINPGFVYVFYLGKDNYYKIGKTNNLDVRLKTLKASNPDLHCIYSVYTKNPLQLEKLLHKTLDNFRVEREIFVFENITASLDRIKRICDKFTEGEDRFYGSVREDLEYLPEYVPPKMSISSAWKLYKKEHKHDRLGKLTPAQFYRNLYSNFIQKKLYKHYQ